MIKRNRKSKNINFLLENRHYKTLHLLLYLITIMIVTIVYFVTLLIFSVYVHTSITVLSSLLLGLYVVFKRDKVVKILSEKLQNHKRRQYKKNSRENLKTTLRKITPKNTRLKLNISGKTSIKEKMSNVKNKFNKKGKKGNKNSDYIEIN